MIDNEKIKPQCIHYSIDYDYNLEIDIYKSNLIFKNDDEIIYKDIVIKKFLFIEFKLYKRSFIKKKLIVNNESLPLIVVECWKFDKNFSSEFGLEYSKKH